ncbi:MAG TPA: hypothetical protein VK179_03980 [Bacteroidales bacterium]|nr:hypothetical protein [Bacteroidales bacterium]
MKKLNLIIALLLVAMYSQAQSVEDLFERSDVSVTYLGIDFSHVKLIGNFAEFADAGRKNVMEIRDIYFPKWNMVVVNEREKFDLAGMLRKSDIYYDTDIMSVVNSQTRLDEMEAMNTVKFSDEDIASFISQYDLSGKVGIGIVFIAECLNKSAEDAIFHFVAFDMKNGNLLFHRRLHGDPNGIGLRNYWVNSLYRIINNIKFFYFDEWRVTALLRSYS